MSASATVEAQGHLIDSGILGRIFDRVIEHGGRYEVIRFDIGRTNDEYSRLGLRVETETQATLDQLVGQLVELGCTQAEAHDARLKPADADAVVPDDFYSTTNHRTAVRLDGEWTPVEQQRMDAVIVVKDGRASCRKLRDVKAGEQVVCGVAGVRLQPEFKPRDRSDFAFMSNDISSERRVETAVRQVVSWMKAVKAAGERICWVAGPVVIHTGGAEAFRTLIERGYVDALLSGNALAVHDVEQSLFGTSLGIHVESGLPVEYGHQHHMRAINTVNRYGGLAGAVRSGAVQTGIVHACVTHGVDLVLAGSIRDDGPLPDTITDMVEAQNRYSAVLADRVGMVICLSTMLHTIGVGNMLPAWIRMVCVDINPSVVTKLADRGSTQTVGIVTDVGLFLNTLAERLDG